MNAIPPGRPRSDAQGWLICGLAVVIGVLPLWPAGRLSPHDFQRFAECLILLAAALLIWQQPTWLPRLHGRPGLVAASLLLLTLASCWHSRYTGAALQEMALWLGLLGWAWVCRQQVRAGAQRPLLRAMAATMAAYAAMVLLLYLTSLASGELLDARAFIIGFANPRFLNHVQTVAVPLLWVVAVSDSERRWRWLAAAAATAQIALTALTLARATLLAWLVALAVLTMLRERRVSRHGWLALASGLVGALLIFVVLPGALDLAWRPSFASPAGLNAAHSRDLLWVAALDQFLNSPWLGQGPMHFAAQPNPTAAHPHNIYLQLTAELGLPGALLLLGLLLTPLARGVRRLYGTTASEPLLAGSLAAVVAALVDGAFSGNFVMPLSQLWIAAAWGLLAGTVGTPDVAMPGPPGSSLPSRTRKVATLLVVAQLALCTGAAVQVLREPPRMRSDSPVPTAGETYRPRFWLDGWI